MSERMQTGDLIRADADEPIGRDTGGGDGSQQALDPLFDGNRADELHDRWERLQSRFVDDPRETVQEADALVAELLQELAQGFNDARTRLEDQWSRGDDVSTEELRLTLQRYRSFFERLLHA
jgi:hypothetical protein